MTLTDEQRLALGNLAFKLAVKAVEDYAGRKLERMSPEEVAQAAAELERMEILGPEEAMAAGAGEDDPSGEPV